MVAPEVVVAEEIVAKTTTQQGLGQEITDTKALEDIADVVWPADES